MKAIWLIVPLLIVMSSCAEGQKNDDDADFSGDVDDSETVESEGRISDDSDNGWSDDLTDRDADMAVDSDGGRAIYRPPVGVSWQWQLTGTLNTAYNAELYDIDLFDTPQQTIDELHAAGKRVICYFSAGSYENWRPDKELFQKRDLGNPLDGWDGERWLDIRSEQVKDIMKSRLDRAAAKGCDGVEPDNVDGYDNNSGFPLTAADQIAYNRFLAMEAHRRGLSVGLKNDLNQVKELVSDFDFSVNEQCFEYNECALLVPFIEQGKPVLNAEYRQKWVDDNQEREKLCEQSLELHFSTLILPIDLDDSFRYSCL